MFESDQYVVLNEFLEALGNCWVWVLASTTDAMARAEVVLSGKFIARFALVVETKWWF